MSTPIPIGGSGTNPHHHTPAIPIGTSFTTSGSGSGILLGSAGGHSPMFSGLVGTPKNRPSFLSQLSPLMLSQTWFGHTTTAVPTHSSSSTPIHAGGSTPTGTTTTLLPPNTLPTLSSHPSSATSTPTPASISSNTSVSSTTTTTSPPPLSITNNGNVPISPDAFIRKTKICCTLGPATSSVDALISLLCAGMNLARFNFSHGTHEGHLHMLTMLRQAIQQTGQECAFLLDTKGPEIRTGLLKGGEPIELKIGQELLLRTDLTPLEHEQQYQGNPRDGISVDYPRLGSVLDVGSVLKIDDGLIVTKVIECLDSSTNTNRPVRSGVRVRVENNGVLGERKGINLPGTHVDLPSVTERDKLDLRFAVDHGFHFIAASFARNAEGIQEIRAILNERAPTGKLIQIISKIENQQGLDNFESILSVSDGIMVARGDLGVEIPIQKVSTAQKMMIRRCNCLGKPVITATQMLESMVTNPRPTRAEATDVSNAVFDGSDCVMLSGETAKGAYSTQAVQVMSAICCTSEKAMDYASLYATIVQATRTSGVMLRKSEAITMSAVKVAQDLQAKAIFVFSESGSSARLVAKYRPAAPIILLTPSLTTHRQARLLRGVWSLKVEREQDSNSLVQTALTFAKSKGWITEHPTALQAAQGIQQMVVLVSGNQSGVAGASNTMRIIEV